MQLKRFVPEDSADIFVKLEYFSPTGSYKDRMAKSLIEEAEHRGELTPNTTVVEATGGSTGSSLAFVCAVKGYKFMALSSDAYAKEKLQTMAAFGATVNITHSPTGKATADLMASMKSRAAELGSTEGYFHTDQFSNRDALVGYEDIGRELNEQFPDGLDAFCGSFGTAGMVMGVSGILKSKIPGVRVVLLEPETAALLANGRSGSHGVDGIAPGFISAHVDENLYVRFEPSVKTMLVLCVVGWLEKKACSLEHLPVWILQRLSRSRRNWGQGRRSLRLRVILG